MESEAGEADDSDSGDDFICLHEKFITESRKKSELRAEGVHLYLHIDRIVKWPTILLPNYFIATVTF